MPVQFSQAPVQVGEGTGFHPPVDPDLLDRFGGEPVELLALGLKIGRLQDQRPDQPAVVPEQAEVATTAASHVDLLEHLPVERHQATAGPQVLDSPGMVEEVVERLGRQDLRKRGVVRAPAQFLELSALLLILECGVV